MGLSVNHFANLGAECHFPKIRCSESSFLKKMRCKCNLPKKNLKKKKKKKKGLNVNYFYKFGSGVSFPQKNRV